MRGRKEHRMIEIREVMHTHCPIVLLQADVIGRNCIITQRIHKIFELVTLVHVSKQLHMRYTNETKIGWERCREGKGERERERLPCS